MVDLYGGALSRSALAERTGALQQVAGVQLVELADGPERGVRVLVFRTGCLGFQVAVDRGFDLLSAEYRGVPIGWRSPTGPRHPSLASPEENGGWGLLRSFTGLLATCGLDQALAPTSSSAERYIYPGFDRHDYPLHGRVSQIPARLRGYGERWDGERCTLWAEAEVAQMAVFGENLLLTRRFEAQLGGSTIAIDDRVENRGFRPTPHMLLYHFNFGYPLLDEGSEFLAPIREIVHAIHDLRDQGTGYRIQGPPQADFREQVYQHEVVAGTDGMASALLINPNLGAGGLGRAPRLRPDSTALPDRVAVPAVRPLCFGYRALDQPSARARLRRAARRADRAGARRCAALSHAADHARRRRGDRSGARGDPGLANPTRGFRAGNRRLAGVEGAVVSAVRCVANPRAEVGEGPVWDDRAGVLRWVDIKGQRLFRFDPASGENHAWAMPERLGYVVPRQDHGLLGGFKTGFKWIDPDTGAVAPIVDPEPDRPGNRFNDGKCDPRGRLFAGTMDDAEVACTGTLYRLDPDLSVHVVRRDVHLSNGLGWSPDERTMYYTDSKRLLIWAYDYDPGLGRAENERVFARIPSRCRRAGWDVRRCARLRLERPLGRLAADPLRARRADRSGAGDAGAAAQLLRVRWTRSRDPLRDLGGDRHDRGRPCQGAGRRPARARGRGARPAGGPVCRLSARPRAGGRGRSRSGRCARPTSTPSARCRRPRS